jgi:hypothetical protein
MFLTIHKNRSLLIILCFILFFLLWQSGYCGEKPLLAVLDLDYQGVSKRDATLLTDIMTMNIMETGKVHCISRLERTKLLKAHGFPLAESKIKEYYPEIASLIYADYLAGGMIKKEKTGYRITLHLYENAGQQIIKIKEAVYPDFDAGMNNMREFTIDFLSGVTFTFSPTDLSGKVTASLSPVPIKEKILFLFDAHHGTREWAHIKKLFYILITLFTEDPRYQPFFTESKEDVLGPASGEFQMPGNSMDYQWIALCKEVKDQFYFILYTTYGEEKFAIPLDRDFSPEKKAEEIHARFNDLPPLPQGQLIKEIRKNLYLEEKIDELLYLEKISSHTCNVRFYQKTLKSLFTPNLNPNLNLISFESDFYWYYLQYLGSGIGYGFNLGYPGTIDSALNNHPLIYQHEFRIIPLSLRTASTVSIVLQNILALSFHNISIITDHLDGPFTYSDAGFTFYLKCGLNMGLLFHQSEKFALYLDIITLYYTFPLVPHPQYDNIRHFSGDLLGAGVSLSF